jgi:branched-chain amino acid transport system ATP-binding protein
VTLIGNNGAGKTTLLMVLSGLVRHAQGEVKILGNDVASHRPHELIRSGLAHVPQGRQLFPQMTVEENLELGARATRPRADIGDQFDEVFSYFPRLAERRRQLAGTLSGGEQQMVAVGRALMAEPSVLLFDEPSAGLAPVMVDTLADAMRSLNERGMTILLVEQNAFLALELAERAYVMETGVIVEHGRTGELIGSERVRRAYLGI